MYLCTEGTGKDKEDKSSFQFCKTGIAYIKFYRSQSKHSSNDRKNMKKLYPPSRKKKIQLHSIIKV